MMGERIATRGLQLRSNGADQPTVTGYAAVFYRSGDEDTEFAMRNGMVERIRGTAFEDTLASDAEVVALVQHDITRPLGRRSMGTLRLWTDQRGLAFELDLPNNSDGRDLAESIRRGDVDSMSFGFSIPKHGSTITREKGKRVRDLKSVVLREVSPVTFPAYRGTSVSVRTAGAEVLEHQDQASRLRKSKAIGV